MKQKNKKGSLTVETALLLPAAVSIILFFLHLFRILWAEQQLAYAGLEVMQTVSDCGYLLKYAGAELELAEKKLEGYEAVAEAALELLRGAGSIAWFRSSLQRSLPEDSLTGELIKGGLDGISYWGSDIYAEDEMTVICISCQLKFPVFHELLPDVTMEKRFLMRSFSGAGELEIFGEETEKETEEGFVYVTETGTVYHESRDCTYIKPSLQQKAFDCIGQSRNASGGIYYPCASCVAPQNCPAVVWVTKTGTHYHSAKDCSRIKRSVKKITVQEAEKYRPCSKCAAGQ